jgi:hypothetical protein
MLSYIDHFDTLRFAGRTGSSFHQNAVLKYKQARYFNAAGQARTKAHSRPAAAVIRINNPCSQHTHQ